MAARIADVCDAVASAIDTWWQAATPAKGAADTVSRGYEPDLNVDPQSDSPRPAGRAVYVFPAESVHAGMDNRGEDLDEHAVAVCVVEWFDGSDAPDRAWLDARMLFLDSLWRLLRNVRAEPEVVAGSWPQAAAVTEWYDPQALRTDRAFFGSLVVSYREHTTDVTAP